jgi:hypothetical protein
LYRLQNPETQKLPGNQIQKRKKTSLDRVSDHWLPGWVNPDKAIVAEDDTGPARQLVEVGLPPLDETGAYLSTRDYVKNEKVALIFCHRILNSFYNKA